MGKELNLEDYQQINQMKWKKTYWVEMVGKPQQKVGMEAMKWRWGLNAQIKAAVSFLQVRENNSKK